MADDTAPDMYAWYVDYYRATQHSQAHAAYCTRVYGRDLCQHGYTTMAQLDDLLRVGQVGPGCRVLDLGCGNGMIAEAMADQTGACVHGIDYVPDAIAQALARTAAHGDRLTFQVADMNALDLPPASFDVIVASDTLYYGDLHALLGRLKAALRPGGQMLIFYTHILWNEGDDRAGLLPEGTPLGQALRAHGLCFEAWDYTRQEYERALVSRAALADLRAAFEAEGNAFLADNRTVETEGTIRFYESGRISRTLYRVTMDA